MSKIEQALKSAIEAISQAIYSDDGLDGYKGQAVIKRLEACKAAISDIEKCEPVGWQFYQDGKWHNGMETNNHKENTIDAGIPVRDLYTSPQPIGKCEPVANRNEAVSHLWESIGLWSAYLASNGEQAELSPPSWLVDAINNATSPQQREWKDIDLSEYENQGLGGIAEEICTKLKQLNAKG